jgi:uncharacterized protein (DUF1684 family)
MPNPQPGPEADRLSADRPYVDLWDWRRRIADLYAAIRAGADPQQAWQHWRATRDAMFRSHPQSPLDAAARGEHQQLACFPYDPAWRVAVAIGPPAEAPVLDLQAGSDGVLRLQPLGRTQGLTPLLGTELTIWWLEGYAGGAFLPFADATSGRETYGGGRYLLDTAKGADLGTDAAGRTILDFNFAYFPSCAYSAQWVCPLAPPLNRVNAAVRAGERLSATARAPGQSDGQ